MEILIILLRIVFVALPAAAVIEAIAALFSARVRRYIAQRPIAHLIWFVCAVIAGLLLIPAPGTRHGGF